MALRDQPYLPLYIQDIMTDEKLNECSAATHGIYIKGLMCLMHKSQTYGKILLKQKYKQSDKPSKNFASMLVKHLPYSVFEIEEAIDELIKEEVCHFEGSYLCQKRMIRDNEISQMRSEAGKKGGGNPNFVKTKIQTSSEDEYEYENKDEDTINKKEVKTIDEKKQQMEMRRGSFAQQVLSKKEYDQDMLTQFFEYWSESTKSGIRMRFELQTTWELDKRLATWQRNTEKKSLKKNYHGSDFDNN